MQYPISATISNQHMGWKIIPFQSYWGCYVWYDVPGDEWQPYNSEHSGYLDYNGKVCCGVSLACAIGLPPIGQWDNPDQIKTMIEENCNEYLTWIIDES